MDSRDSSEERPQSSLPSSLIQHLYTGPQPRDSSTRTTLFEDEPPAQDQSSQILPRLPPPDLILPPPRMQPVLPPLQPPVDSPFRRSSQAFSAHPMVYSEVPSRRISPPLGRPSARSPSVPGSTYYTTMPRQQRPQSVSHTALPPLQPTSRPSSLHQPAHRDDRGQNMRVPSPTVKLEASDRYDLGAYRRSAYPEPQFGRSRRIGEQPGPSNYQPDPYSNYPRSYGEQTSPMSAQLSSDLGPYHEHALPPYAEPQPIASSSRLSPFYQEQAQSRAEYGYTPGSSVGTSYSMQDSPTGRQSGAEEQSAGDSASSTSPQGNDHDNDEWTEHPIKRRKKEETEERPNNRTGKKTGVACDFCRGRKLRCDGKRPQCYNCFSRDNQPCVYQPAPRRRGPGKKPRVSKAKQEAREPSVVSTGSRPTLGMGGEDREPGGYERQHHQQSFPSTSARSSMGSLEIPMGSEDRHSGGFGREPHQQRQQPFTSPSTRPSMGMGIGSEDRDPSGYRRQQQLQQDRLHQQRFQQDQQYYHQQGVAFSSSAGMGGSTMMQMDPSGSANPYPILPPISSFEHNLEAFDTSDAPRGRSRAPRRRKRPTPPPPGSS